MKPAVARTVPLWLQTISSGVYDVWNETADVKLGRVVRKARGWTAFDSWGFPTATELNTRQQALDTLTLEE